jgi:hypothetical protein
MLKSKKLTRTLDIHRYTLRRGILQYADGVSVADDIAISMGEHGVMHTHPLGDQKKADALQLSKDAINDLAAHNIAETQRAIEESEKWNKRLLESPLGKTQQDFVAYYTEVLSLFAEWHTANNVSISE